MRTTLHLMLLRAFFPVLLIAVAFFVTMLQLVDLFENITRYIDLEVPFTEVFRVQLLYLPRSLHFALPMSLLFAVSFSLGTLYGNNELIAILGSGVPFRGFILPLLMLGLLLSVGSFYFEEHLVIDASREKNSLEEELLNINRSASNSNVTRLGDGTRVVYHADYYNDGTQTLSNVVILQRDDAGVTRRVVSARSARWNGELWEAQNARVFMHTDEGILEEFRPQFSDETLDLLPTAFQRRSQDIAEMRIAEARAWIDAQRASGLAYREDLTKYHERYSFALTPFIVVLISAAIGGRLKKNILLMSLLISLIVSVVYYVSQMVSGLMAYSGLISPIFGAWSGVLLFVIIGGILLRTSRT